MSILYVTAECKPFAKAGGVGDVAGELCVELLRQDVDISVVIPLYGVVPGRFVLVKSFEYTVLFQGEMEAVTIFSGELAGVPVYFVANTHYFEGEYSTPYIHSVDIPYYDDTLRFSFFCKALIPLICKLEPHIIHANDWPTGYLFGWLEKEGIASKRVFTVHNASYQGNIGIDVVENWTVAELLDDEHIRPHFTDPETIWNSINPLRLGVELADIVNTVSPTYQEEICEPGDPSRWFIGGGQLHQQFRKANKSGVLHGILNGYQYTSPAREKDISQLLLAKESARKELADHFNYEPDLILGFVGRAVEQKLGMLLATLDRDPALTHILKQAGIAVVMVTSGQPVYERQLMEMAHLAGLHLKIAFDAVLADQVYLGCDVFLMPSVYEPCGITQLQAMSLGTPALVRNTGGLADTVIPHTQTDGNGFVFTGDTRQKLLLNMVVSCRQALNLRRSSPEKFQALQIQAAKQRFTWDMSAQQYRQNIYQPLLES